MIKSMLITTILGLWLRSANAGSALSLISAVALAAVAYVLTYRHLNALQAVVNIWEVATIGSLAYLLGVLLFRRRPIRATER